MSGDRWTVSVSPPYDRDIAASVSEDDKRAGDLLELLLADRLEDLIAWARGELTAMSGALLVAVKDAPK